ncbi:hypothetical protein CTU88_17460 [Streptomyces sp. JV178]|nr:hypothetical protein CTU88_17460 [Streptomyces sp. JV178]
MRRATDMGRGDLTDAEWERLRPFLPVSNRRRGRWRDHRQVIHGIPRGPPQEAQHPRTGDQALETVPGRRHSLRQAWLRLPRHRDRPDKS